MKNVGLSIMDFTALFGNQTPGSESEESLPTSSTAPRSTPAYSTSAPPSTVRSAQSTMVTASSGMTRRGSFFDDRGEAPRPGYVPLTRKKAGKGRRQRGLKKTRRMKSRRRRV